MNWTDLVKSRMKEIGMTQDGLAENMGVSQASIARYLNKKREPDIDTIAKIMKCVGLSEMILKQDGTVRTEAELSNTSKADRETQYKGSYPLINAVQAGNWTEVCEPFTEYDSGSIEMIPTTEKASGGSFWLTVEGDSMTSPVGISIPSGARILVDPSIQPANGNLVVAKLDNVNEATFKKLVVDSGQKYLKPLNPNYPLMPINGNCKIIGVVVDAKLKIF
ncbi:MULTISPECIES: LexA family protein [unclassified Vibrio]|uniref:LexA family protein n=1 Tax=unclassified Vibrio TaxID=2614977 RepID=UPI001F0A6E38|nr:MULTISPECIES: S24 family peptidase [unclassified Vibrio]